MITVEILHPNFDDYKVGQKVEFDEKRAAELAKLHIVKIVDAEPVKDDKPKRKPKSKQA